MTKRALKDNQCLYVSTQNAMIINTINQANELFFKRQFGLQKTILPAAKKYHDCSLLQVYSVLTYCQSFKSYEIKKQLPPYIAIIKKSKHLTRREFMHCDAAIALSEFEFDIASNIYLDICKAFPEDRVALSMMEFTAFLIGQPEKLVTACEFTQHHHKNDPNFISYYSMGLIHTEKNNKAKHLIQKSLMKFPDNVLLQHMYTHVKDENNLERINFLEEKSHLWEDYNRFFEGHNWMHLLILKDTFDKDLFEKHIWGKMKEERFEQLNAFIYLWLSSLQKQEDLSRYWHQLASFSLKNAFDYITPYMAISSILPLVKANHIKAIETISSFEHYAKSMSQKGDDKWLDIALPLLQGCIEFCHHDYQKAARLLNPACKDTKMIGQSNVERSIFPATLAACKNHLINQPLVRKKN